MAQVLKAKVFRNGRSQAVRIPAEFRFKSDQVFIERNEQTGVITLSEKPLHLTAAELFARFDAEGPFDFDLDRDMRLPEEREIV